MKKRIISIVMLIALISSLVVISGCGKKEEEVIKIGAILPLTGPLASYGKEEARGLKLALKNINKDEKKFELLIEDSKAQSKEAVLIAQKMLNNDINFLFTSLTGVSLSIKPLIKNKDALQIVLGMSESIPLNQDNVFRIYPGIKEEGEKIFEYLDSNKIKKLALVHYEQSAFDIQINDVLLPACKKNHIKIVANETFGKNISLNLKNIVTKLKILNPDFIYVGAYYNQLPVLLKGFAEYKLLKKTKVISGLNMEVALEQGLLSNIDTDGFIIAAPLISNLWISSQNISREEFVMQYREEYGKSPNYDSAFAYDAFMILDQYVHNNNYNIKDIINSLKNSVYNSEINGKITIDAQGNSNTSWELGEVHNGKLEKIN